jgi:membrane associated rhomboid family serine protease
MHLHQPIRILSYLFAVLFIVQIVNSLTQGLLSSFGIYPRTLQGLLGIPLAPWIHHNWQHLLSNSAPLAVLAFIVLQQGLKRFLYVWVLISLFAGSAVWLFANEGYHAGASTLVFGLVGYVISHALFSRNIFYIILAGIVCFLYASIITSLTEFLPGVSWTSHFFGFLSGLFLGRIFAQKNN